MRHPLAIVLCILVLTGSVVSQRPERRDPSGGDEILTITEKTKDMKKHEGFFTFYWDTKAEQIWLEIENWDKEFLHAISTASGVAGRDRGGWGGQRVLKFSRSGRKVFLIQPNYSYRAVSDDPLERRAVGEAYTDSIVAGFPVGAEEEGRVLVDATDFFMREGARGSVDRKRSAFHWPRTKNFPGNTEFEVTLTTTGGGDTGGRGDAGRGPGRPRGQMTRRGRGGGGGSTIRLHHSFVQLPDSGYKPRRYDPRAGVGSTSYKDYAAPIQEPIRKRFITRHRLEKKDPEAPISDPVEPIVYYVDPGAPEPIRSALVEGASWWNEAFEAIGFRNAFQVKVLPEDADPMDLRYNMILWTHRPDRGWSVGTSVRDPRTGEIITGRVFLGSQRVRQDFLIGAGLVAPYGDDKQATAEILGMVLARARQLSAHEVGHTLGFGHNFAASTRGRASVMDYPHPLVKIREDESFDLSDAYDVGIGEWDKVSIAYAYTHFPPAADENKGLDAILDRAHKQGHFFLGQVGAGSASPLTHQWDNGPDALAEFARVMKIRSLALARFSEKNIPHGAPLSSLEDVLVPVYLFHRYQTEAVSKSLGGVDYRFANRGDGQVPMRVVAPGIQRQALDALLSTIRPETLAIPQRILDLIPPRSGFGGEVFPRHTSPTFDPLSAAETAANHTVGFILNSSRAARLVAHHAINPDQPGLEEVIDRLIEATWKANHQGSPYLAEIGRTVDSVVLRHLMSLAASTRTSTQVRAIANLKLNDMRMWMETFGMSKTDRDAHRVFALRQIRHFQNEPTKFELTEPSAAPPGAPIGMGEIPLRGMVHECAFQDQ